MDITTLLSSVEMILKEIKRQSHNIPKTVIQQEQIRENLRDINYHTKQIEANIKLINNILNQ